MEKLLPFEFGYIYHFWNDDIIPPNDKFHIHIGEFDDLTGTGARFPYFFLINSNPRKKEPNLPIFKGAITQKKYTFLSHDSHVGCGVVFPAKELKGGKPITRMFFDDMEKIVEFYASLDTAEIGIVKYMEYYLHNQW